MRLLIPAVTAFDSFFGSPISYDKRIETQKWPWNIFKCVTKVRKSFDQSCPFAKFSERCIAVHSKRKKETVKLVSSFKSS